MKPIIFNTEMVQAILNGRKSVTRRVIKPQPTFSNQSGYCWKNGAYGLGSSELQTLFNWTGPMMEFHSPYQVGDVLWVRETSMETGVIGSKNVKKAKRLKNDD